MSQVPDSNNSMALQTMSSLSRDDKKEVIAAGLSQLEPKDKQAVLNQAGIRSPGQKASDMLWLIVVLSFAIVLVGAFLSLAYGVLVLKKSAADAELQILLTVFTSAVAFLAGLLTPGPAHSQSSNQ